MENSDLDFMSLSEAPVMTLKKVPEFQDKYGIGVKGGETTLLEMINACLNILKAQGKMEQLREQYTQS